MTWPKPPLHGTLADASASPEEQRREFARFARVLDLVGFSTRYVGKPGELAVFNLVVEASHKLLLSRSGVEAWTEYLTARGVGGVSMWD